MTVELKLTFGSIDEALEFMAGKPAAPREVKRGPGRPPKATQTHAAPAPVAAVDPTAVDPAGPAPAPAPVAAPEPTPSPTPATPAQPAVAPVAPATAATDADVRAALMKVNEKFGKDGLTKVSEIIGAFGVQRISELKPEQHRQVVEAATKAIA